MGRVDVVLRDRRPADEALIRATWLRALRGGDRSIGRTPSDWYYAAQGALITQLLARATTRVAHYLDDPDQILGYAVGEPARGVLHWLYVKGTFRRLGVARQLLDDLLPGIQRRCSHWSRGIDPCIDALGLVRDLSTLRYDG